MGGPATLRVDASSLDTAASGAVTGRIWFDGEETFPDAGWFDFPIVVLTWWLQLLARLSAGQTKSGDVRFMDGPFRVSANLTDDGVLRLEYLSGRAANPVGTSTITLTQALDDGIGAARALLAECRERGWASDDIDRLANERKEAEQRRSAIRST